MIKLENDLTFVPQIYSKTKSPYYMTYINGIVTNPFNKKKTLTVKEFIVDTGAAITVLNSSFKFLFSQNDTPIIEYVNLHYGGGITKKPLPVYQIKIKILGYEFDVPAAFDENMLLTSLLGHFGFINTFDHLGVSMQRKRITLIR